MVVVSGQTRRVFKFSGAQKGKATAGIMVNKFPIVTASIHPDKL